MEKVIREWRIIEVDDGYRIEIKGDKEAMRRWVEHFRPWARRRMHRHWPPFWGGRAHFWGHDFECCDEDADEGQNAEQTET